MISIRRLVAIGLGVAASQLEPVWLTAQVQARPVSTAASTHPSSVQVWGLFRADTEARHGRFLKVAAGWNTTAVLRSDGRLFINGQNRTRMCDPPPPPPSTRYVDVSLSACDSFGFGLLSDGTVAAWGSLYMLPGAGGTITPPVPPQLPPGMRYVQAVAGPTAMLLRSDGALIVWGDNSSGQLNVPGLPSGVHYDAIYESRTNCGALLSDGTIQIWGDNSLGQWNVPALPAGLRYISLAIGVSPTFAYLLALRSDGQIVAWGDNRFGQCNVPVLPPGISYTMVAAGESHAVALRSDGVLVAWGNQAAGLCNVPTLPQGVIYKGIACGQIHSVALTSQGKVVTWGHNSFFESSIPEIPSDPAGNLLARYIDASTRCYHTLLVLSDGSLQVFGDQPQSSVPMLPPGTRYVRARAGVWHDLALRSDGTLVAWGDNSVGQCNVPSLPVGTRYVDLAISEGHSVALRSDGVAVAFGDNGAGQCNVPTLPPGVIYTNVAANRWKTLLLRSDGQIVCLGDTAYNQGIVPTPPPGVRYVQVAACTNGTWNGALRSDGEVAIWDAPIPNYWPYARLPALPWGMAYVEIIGGYQHFGLRRSDGQIVTAGSVSDNEDRVPALEPGTSYVQVCTSGWETAGRVGPTSTYLSFGRGCAGSRRATRLIPCDTPRIGKPHEVRLLDLPQGTAILVFGWRRLALPMLLDPLGMPGCQLAISADRAFFVSGSGHEAVCSMPIPDLPALVGMHFYQQALVLDLAAGNALGAVVSDAAEGVIGHW